MTPHHIDLFHESYTRALLTGDFLEDFYDAYLGSSEEVAKKFKDVDVAVKSKMLYLALIQLAAYFTSGVPGRSLQRVAENHSRTQRNIEPCLFDDWLNALIATAKTHDGKWNGKTELAWRRVLDPGIAYMKSCY